MGRRGLPLNGECPLRPDLLAGYEAETLPLSPDCEGPVDTTLIRYVGRDEERRVALYLHGYNDYFHCAEMGPRFHEAGWGFYALDLRKHGRSMRDHQTPGLVRRLEDYYEDIDRALSRIRQLQRVDEVVLVGHSTGGLIAPLYAADRGGVDALFLNAPFFAFPVPRRTDLALRSLVRAVGRVRPETILQREPDPRYAWSLHKEFGRGGEWDFDLSWKRPGDLPLRAGFIGACARGHERIRAGLRLRLPILVGVSSRSGGKEEGFGEEWLSTDTVIDPVVTLRRSRRLGPRVEFMRVDRGLHDLVLSAPPVRATVYARLFDWLGGVA